MESAVESLKPVDFLIVTALQEEREAVLQQLEPFEPVRGGESPIYYFCTLPAAHNVYKIAIMQLPQMGNVTAAVDVTQAIAELNPACVLMVGIAAGIRGKVDLGDVIIATQLIYYEQGRIIPKELEIRPLTIPADVVLLHSVENYSADECWNDTLCEHTPNSRGIPTIHFGPFAVGEKVVAAGSYVVNLVKLHPKLIGVEMESYGVAAAAASAFSRPRFLAIRGVSDFADEQKSDEYRQYATTAAATFAISFLSSGIIPPSIIHTAASPKVGTLIAIRHLSMEHIPSHTIVASLPPKFASLDVTEILINQTDLYIEDRLSDPLAAVRRQTLLASHLDDLLNAYPATPVAYFGIAHIPLLFYLGYSLTTKRQLHLFEFDRYASRWNYLHGKQRGPRLQLEGMPALPINEAGDVLIRVSITHTIRLPEVSEIIPSPIVSVHLYLEPPKRDAVVSEYQLHNYGIQFRQMLDDVHELLPNRRCTHIFYAGPASLAVYFGQLISHTVDRDIVVYNYTAKDSPGYSWGLEITASSEASGFLIRYRK
ncbi:MAG TPA: SAVED domain-containing protein [Anaerolineae bacterium]|nr:SAVED domain-containing protein [Anaerolineae bacterium]